MIDLIIVPQGAEYKAVKQGLKKLKNARPLIIQIPMGVNQIAETLTRKQFWQTQPKRVLMMGLCGSLSSQYSVGNAVLYRDCYDRVTKENLFTDRQLNQVISQKIEQTKTNKSLFFVSGITSDRIITTIPEKQKLAQNFTASVVDMESFAYLNLLQQKEVAVSIIRVISDDLKYNLPDLENTIGDRGNIKPLVMTKKMLKQPTASFRFIRSSLQGLQKLQEITTNIFVK